VSHPIILSLLVLGAIVFGRLALSSIRSARDFIRNGIRTLGRVVRFDDAANDGTIYLHPIFSFNDSAGQEHIVRSLVGYSQAPFSVGSEVSLIYPADSPELVEPVGDSQWTATHAFGGMFFLCIGFATLLLAIDYFGVPLGP
jgi:hypothetical protein